MPPALGHSGYMRDPAMRHEVDCLAGQLLVEAATPAPVPLAEAPAAPPVEGPAGAVPEPGGSA